MTRALTVLQRALDFSLLSVAAGVLLLATLPSTFAYILAGGTP